MKPTCKEADITTSKIHYTKISDVPPQIIKIPKINLNLNKHQKTSTQLHNVRKKLEKIKERYPQNSYMFTDELKYEKAAKCAVVYSLKI